MLIQFFRNNSFIQFLGLLILGAALWLNVFIAPPPIAENSFTTPLYNLFTSITNNHLIFIFLTLIILIVQAIYLNHVLIRHELIHRNSFLAAFLYMVLMSHSLQLQHLYPALIGSFFVIVTIDSLLEFELKEDYLRLSFKAGFYLGLASLFYLPILILLLFIWGTLFIYRIPNWRPWVIPIVGIITPYVFLFTYYFWIDAAESYLTHYQNYFSEIKLLYSSTDGYVRVIMTILVFFMTISITRVLGRINEKKIVIRKKIKIILNLFFICVIILFVNNDLIIHASVIYIPVSIFMTIYFSELRKAFWPDLIFSLTVLLIIFAHFQS